MLAPVSAASLPEARELDAALALFVDVLRDAPGFTTDELGRRHGLPSAAVEIALRGFVDHGLVTLSDDGSYRPGAALSGRLAQREEPSASSAAAVGEAMRGRCVAGVTTVGPGRGTCGRK